MSVSSTVSTASNMISPVVGDDVKIPTYKPHINHKRSSVRSHTLPSTSICDLSHSLCWSPLTDLGHISSVTYVCHPLMFVCGHRKGILTSPLGKPVCWVPFIVPLTLSTCRQVSSAHDSVCNRGLYAYRCLCSYCHHVCLVVP